VSILLLFFKICVNITTLAEPSTEWGHWRSLLAYCLAIHPTAILSPPSIPDDVLFWVTNHFTATDAIGYRYKDDLLALLTGDTDNMTPVFSSGDGPTFIHSHLRQTPNTSLRKCLPTSHQMAYSHGCRSKHSDQDVSLTSTQPESPKKLPVRATVLIAKFKRTIPLPL
jgi:hypothetical protein